MKKTRAPRAASGPFALHFAGPRVRGPARASYMFSIITCPKPEQLTCVAPSIKRAKS